MYLCICLSVCVSVCLSTYLSMYLSINIYCEYSFYSAISCQLRLVGYRQYRQTSVLGIIFMIERRLKNTSRKHCNHNASTHFHTGSV